MKYNIFIQTTFDNLTLQLLEEKDVSKIVEAYLLGKESVFVKNSKRFLKNLLEIRIFEVEDEYYFLQHWDDDERITPISGTKWIPKVLAKFGKDVTDTFIQDREYGELKDKKYSFSSALLHEQIWSIIHPKISMVSKERCLNGHYADAVEAAFKELNDIIKIDYKILSGKELDGRQLMQTAFSPSNPTYELDDLNESNGKNIQEGYMFIFAGSMQGIRNPKAHRNLTITEEDAIEKIFIASHLLKIFENRIS